MRSVDELMFGIRAKGEAVAGAEKNVVQSAGKVFAVLRAFDAGHPELTISEVAGRAGLDRGTAFRLIHTLVGLGYLAAVPNSRRFRLTLKCLELGYAALTRAGLNGQAAPLLRELVPQHADAASLGVLDGADVVYVERFQVDMARPDLDRRVGSRTGAYASALGHAMLAWRDPAEARQVLASAERVRLSDRTLIDLDELMERLASVRERGYAVSDGENAYGLRTIAAPILDADSQPIAGISLSVRSERVELNAFIEDALPLLLRAAQALTRAARFTAAR
jgi:IclR family transcriptional regulator, pca regulon regulatory protein